MEETVREERKKWIEELTEVIGRADTFLKEACEYYEWDIKDLEKVAEENHITCPFDKSHIVPERSIHRHLESCEWRSLGYTKECKPLPESAISTESPFTIKFDMDLQFKVLQEAKQKNLQLDIGTDEKLIPQTSDRLTSDFTRDERKAMYEYVVDHTVAPDVGQDIQDLNKPEKKEERSTSLLELLAQERNLKRRKTRYRGVHTNKKSHIEIMREVVQQQMEMYKEYLADKYGVQIPDEDQENSCNNVKKESHSSSRSEFPSSKSRSRDMSRDSHRSRENSTNYRESTNHHSNDSHRSHFKDYNDKFRESHKHRNSDYNKSSRHSSQYEDRDYKSYSKDSSRRRDYRDDDEYDYKSHDRYEDKHHSRERSDKCKVNDSKEYRDKSKSSRDGNRDYNNSDKSYHYDKDNYRGSRKRDRSSSVDKKYNSKSKDDSNKHRNDEKYENGHKSKKHKSHKSSKEKKHKKSKNKHKSRSRSRS